MLRTHIVNISRIPPTAMPRKTDPTSFSPSRYDKDRVPEKKTETTISLRNLSELLLERKKNILNVKIPMRETHKEFFIRPKQATKQQQRFVNSRSADSHFWRAIFLVI